ncbi:MAG: flavodoxin family protein [Bacteroidales bacterium]|nr:flavodoxin family protein [Bacteroidales bacterium]
MKVIAINGSPRATGNTFHALRMAGEQIEARGIDFEIIHIGNKAVRGCLACGKCRENQNEKCVITSDPLNEWVQKMKQADGIILGSPVYYSGIPGTMKSFLDRVFYVSGSNGNLFRHKVGAAVVALRRSGGSSTLDSLMHYLSYSEMILATSNYWNIIHGRTPGEVEQDAEGVQIIRLLGDNMAWLLTLREQTKDSIPAPAPVQKVMTSFIR